MMALAWRKTKDLRTDQRGQAILFGILATFIGLLMVFCVGNMGRNINRRIRVQDAADAAAYSGAVVQANAVSSIAYVNNGVAWMYHYQMHYVFDCVIYGVLEELAKVVDRDIMSSAAPFDGFSYFEMHPAVPTGQFGSSYILTQFGISGIGGLYGFPSKLTQAQLRASTSGWSCSNAQRRLYLLNACIGHAAYWMTMREVWEKAYDNGAYAVSVFPRPHLLISGTNSRLQRWKDQRDNSGAVSWSRDGDAWGKVHENTKLYDQTGSAGWWPDYYYGGWDAGPSNASQKIAPWGTYEPGWFNTRMGRSKFDGWSGTTYHLSAFSWYCTTVLHACPFMGDPPPPTICFTWPGWHSAAGTGASFNNGYERSIAGWQNQTFHKTQDSLRNVLNATDGGYPTGWQSAPGVALPFRLGPNFFIYGVNVLAWRPPVESPFMPKVDLNNSFSLGSGGGAMRKEGFFDAYRSGSMWNKNSGTLKASRSAGGIFENPPWGFLGLACAKVGYYSTNANGSGKKGFHYFPDTSTATITSWCATDIRNLYFPDWNALLVMGKEPFEDGSNAGTLLNGLIGRYTSITVDPYMGASYQSAWYDLTAGGWRASYGSSPPNLLGSPTLADGRSPNPRRLLCSDSADFVVFSPYNLTNAATAGASTPATRAGRPINWSDPNMSKLVNK